MQNIMRRDNHNKAQEHGDMGAREHGNGDIWVHRNTNAYSEHSITLADLVRISRETLLGKCH